MAKVFVFTGHPDSNSLSSALADAYAEGAASAGAQVRRQDLWNMSFDADLTHGYKKRKTLEPCLMEWQENLTWSSHVALFSPMWWGSLPAKTKGVMDRALLPGFGFRFNAESRFPERLLDGRTADVMVTSDTPGWLERIIFARAMRTNITKRILGLLGIKTRKFRHIAVVRSASEREVARWIARARADGVAAAKRSTSKTLAIARKAKHN